MILIRMIRITSIMIVVSRSSRPWVGGDGMTRKFTERGSVVLVLVLSAAVLVIVIDARWGDVVGARRGFSQRRKARKAVGRAGDSPRRHEVHEGWLGWGWRAVFGGHGMTRKFTEREIRKFARVGFIRFHTSPALLSTYHSLPSSRDGYSRYFARTQKRHGASRPVTTRE